MPSGAELSPEMGMFICVPRAHHDTARRMYLRLIVYKQFKKLQELPTDTFVNTFYKTGQERVCAALVSIPQRWTYRTFYSRWKFLMSVVSSNDDRQSTRGGDSLTLRKLAWRICCSPVVSALRLEYHLQTAQVRSSDSDAYTAQNATNVLQIWTYTG
ncbi:hypothetical protein BGW80DRAFT_591229 [Lactifluus volemus]|nr:hypothetical protein BGW80DRAFT_591229 [Lactifluus volemus]